MLQKPSAILFDWDLTLSDSFFALADAYNHVLRKYGLEPCTPAQIKAATALSLKANFIRIFGEDKWEMAGEDFRIRYGEIHMEHVRLMDGAQELLTMLKNKYDCPFGVVSNKTPKFLNQEIKSVGLADTMDIVVGAGEAKADKPSPAPVLMAIEKLGLSTGKSIWYVGDTISDARAGIGAGCSTIIISEPDEVIIQEKPDAYVSNLTELYNLVLDI